MRALSMSETLSETTSEALSLAPEATLSAALYLALGAASSRRATSSWVSTVGSFRGCSTLNSGLRRSGRSSVMLKKNRSAVMAEFTLAAPRGLWTRWRR